MSKKDMIPQEESLEQNLGKIAYTLDKEYFNRLDEDYHVMPYDEEYNKEEKKGENGEVETITINSYVSNVRALKIRRLVYDKEENPNDCLQNALSVFCDSGNTLALVFNRFPDRTDVYVVAKNDGQCKNEESKEDIKLLRDSLASNFAGSKLEVIEEKNGGQDTEKIFFNGEKSLVDDIHYITAVCNIPSKKSEDSISQNIEKLFNGIVPKEDKDWYSVIIFAESITKETMHSMREGLEEMATGLFPFRQHQFQFGENKAESLGEMKTLSDSKSISRAITKTHSINVGMNMGIHGNGVSVGTSQGYGYSWGKTTTKGETETRTTGTNNSITLGESDSTTYSFQSYTVKNILERIEKSLDRLHLGEAIGYWKYSAYVCANSPKVSRNATNYLRSLTQGTESFVESSIIKEWHKESENDDGDFDHIKKYILNFSHPVFINNIDGTKVNFSANINTSELAKIMGLPRHSIQGIPVTAGVSFGREPHSISESISDSTLDLQLGCAYHMFEEQESQAIKISKNELTKHTFITGSTGTGKSNAIYTLLERVCLNQENDKVSFLVIEPAKGEYKDHFGNRDGVKVYGTNKKKIDLLRINPFSFPDDVLVLEHIDSLIEIFNVCWPMYAAMPAVLKDAIERAYISAGWDLTESECKYKNIFDKALYPSFVDVLKMVNVVMEESKYSSDSKGDYIGALCTRLRSLTNGIYRQIFVANELADKELFDSNVIVDLSRVSSAETKSLIMGLLIIKMREYRMSSNKENNNKLSHLTVLEEAHHLLRRTSSDNGSDSSNLLGKSVEMLANSIAEMRTYGEGFVIADQAPGLLDMATIRNTNTKIILGLPDSSDRELVGRAASLNDDQIVELAKLERGVAAIYQNNWLEPVLCKIDKSDGDNKPFEYKEKAMGDTNGLLEKYISFILSGAVDKVDKDEIEQLPIPVDTKIDIVNFKTSTHDRRELRNRIIYNIFNSRVARDSANAYKQNIDMWYKTMVERLEPSIKNYEKLEKIRIIACILREAEQIENTQEINELCDRFNRWRRVVI